MKRKTAREILADSFHELAETKPSDRITVRDIVENCGYSSATFYRQFRDKYDLIVWDYARQIENLMKRIGVDGYTWRKALRDCLAHYLKEKEYLVNILRHTSGHDSFVHYMTEIHCREAVAYIRRSTEGAEMDAKTEMCIRVYCMGTVCLTAEWILGKMEASPEDMAEVYENALPPCMRPAMLKE